MLPTSLMKTAATFASWDKDVWFIGYYPLLKHWLLLCKSNSVSIINAETEINEEDETLTIEASIVCGEPKYFSLFISITC